MHSESCVAEVPLGDQVISRIFLSDKEICTIQSLLDEIACQYNSVEDRHFLKDAAILADELPLRIRRFINDFKSLKSASGVCVISNYPVDDTKIGKTPAHWKCIYKTSLTLKEEMLFVLFSSFLGDAYSLSTEQNGRIINDVIPIQGHQTKQIGTGSEQAICWHTEDAFIPYKPDYLALMCLRNPDKIATTFASINELHLKPEQIKVLFEPRFTIYPDESNSETNNSDLQKQPINSDGLSQFAYQRVKYPQIKPQKVSVLFGDPQWPFIGIDPYFMDSLKNDEEARLALIALMNSIDAKLSGIILQPGDYCFIDNYKTVHGRNSFKARYDGHDRWLKRMRITRDLRKWSQALIDT